MRSSSGPDLAARCLGITGRVSLPPVSAISAMVAPVVLLTMAAILANGLETVYTRLADHMHALSEERQAILKEDDDESLGAERLQQIRAEVPMILRLIHRVRNAAIMIYSAIGLIVLGIIALAFAETLHSEAFAVTALVLVVAGVVVEFLGVATIIGTLVRSADALACEAMRVIRLG
jgi:uncharacterized protein DUF2721